MKDEILFVILTVLNIHHTHLIMFQKQCLRSVDNVDIIQEISHDSKTDKLFVSDKVTHILWTIKFIRQ